MTPSLTHPLIMLNYCFFVLSCPLSSDCAEHICRCSPQAWDEKVAREAANPRLSISPAPEEVEKDAKKEEEDETEEDDKNDQQHLSVCLLGLGTNE